MATRYKEHKEVNFAKVAEEIRAHWEKNRTFEKSVSNREGKETFTFYEGPPSANGISCDQPERCYLRWRL